jgi:hypothetical protein
VSEKVKRFLLRNRIAAPGYGYPASEAKYLSISEWEAATGLMFIEEVVKEKDCELRKAFRRKTY